jgi:hypothetical protein
VLPPFEADADVAADGDPGEGPGQEVPHDA